MAAKKGYSTVQLHDDDDSDDELISSGGTSSKQDFQFHEFATNVLPASIDQLKNETFTNSDIEGDINNDDEDDDDDKKELLSQDKKTPSFWTFEYYQSFFDVDTEQVLSRLLYSMVPQKQNYLLTKIRPKPDYYGPFWVCTTLVFTIAICGNLSSFFASEGSTKWKSDFQLVSLSAGVIFSYAWLLPACLWGFLTWRGNIAGFTFFEILCVYGYSVAVFIPISILWVVPYDWLRWMFVVVGVLVSGTVLALTFWRAVEDDNKKIAVITIAVIVLLHFCLAIGFKLYFFKSIAIRPPDHLISSTVTRSIKNISLSTTSELLLTSAAKKFSS